jgi:hypothetical protein
MKFTVIGLAVALVLTTTSSVEAISMWGPMVLIWLLTAIGTTWVLAGEPDQSKVGTVHKKAA